MTFVEFCEKVAGHELPKWQKEFLEDYYNYMHNNLFKPPLYARGCTKGSLLGTQAQLYLDEFLLKGDKNEQTKID